MKDTLIEIKNILQGNNSRMDEAKNQSNDLEHKEEKTIRTTTTKFKSEGSISSPWDNFKYSNILMIGVLGREEKEHEIGNLFEKY